MDRNDTVQIVVVVVNASLSARRAWIEILFFFYNFARQVSLSARRAWIEIPALLGNPQNDGVALRKESVDRNPACYKKEAEAYIVALRKESVDRNYRAVVAFQHPAGVALRKESVDRNIILTKQFDRPPPVALRKESVDRNLVGRINRTIDIIVALRKESVDRNCMGVTVLGIQHRSLSARRAWIEIILSRYHENTPTGRSPQGERG